MYGVIDTNPKEFSLVISGIDGTIIYPPLEYLWMVDTQYISRAGTNSPESVRNAANVNNSYIPVNRTVSVPEGPRLTYKIRHPKDPKKYIWARKRILVTKLFWMRDGSKSTSGLILPPNSLTMIKQTLDEKFSEPASVVCHIGAKHWSLIGCPFGTFNLSPVSKTGTFAYPSLDSLGPAVTIDAYLDTVASPRAINKYYDNMVGDAANYLQTIGERRQTAGLFQDAILRLTKAIRFAKSGRLWLAAREVFPGDSKELSQDYLIYQFGIKPLISDVQALARDLLFDGNAARRPLKVYGSHRTKWNDPKIIISNSQSSGWITVKTTVKRRHRLRAKYVGYYKLENAIARFMNERGLLDIPAVTWELMPYSFVIDWFLPIGNWIRSRDATNGLSYMFGHKTVCYECEYEMTREFWKPSYYGSPPEFLKSFSSTYKGIQIKRTPLDVPPTKQLPQLKNPSSITHFLESLALARIAMGKKLPSPSKVKTLLMKDIF